VTTINGIDVVLFCLFVLAVAWALWERRERMDTAERVADLWRAAAHRNAQDARCWTTSQESHPDADTIPTLRAVTTPDMDDAP